MTEKQIHKPPLHQWHEERDAKWITSAGWKLPGHYGDVAAEYYLFQSAAALVDKSNCGILKVTGDTAQDFLHRMTSASVEDLRPGHAMETVITTSEGRFVDWVLLVHTGDEFLTMITSPGAQESIVEHLNGYIFFKDDVHFEQIGSDWILLQISGPGSREALEHFHDGKFDPPDEIHEILPFQTAEGGGYLIRVGGILEENYLVLWPVVSLEQLVNQLNSSADRVRPAGQYAYECARIESGIPGYPQEINERYMMLEAHLESPLDMTSCFAGQEVIARTVNFGKIKQHLCHLKFTDQPDGEPELPVRLYSGENRIGWLTSLAPSPHESYSMGLGYVKTKYVEVGVEVEVREDDWKLTGKLTGKTTSR